MKIIFKASLQGRNCLTFDDDGASVVKLTVDASELAQTVKMVTMKGQVFKVTVEEL